ncbi:MAG: tRNA (N6-threonylcarbamoyladenosine(37)-N6)-methyltransferase TrmO [Desulfofustis sp.]|nr:tRNA (N6-threonylcarbamoyladenosine(37)-N6)-methyltransferase TrmO [Desulfofustis sp.]NNK58566.1 tRNA (N6-threonylcarbamoyladenosine(37)-N6)-methyltransferase TrmO [Desulfofustis sp.]
MQPSLKILGFVNNDIRSLSEAPKGYDESDRIGYLEIFTEYLEGLKGIEAGQTIMVLFWLHESSRDILKVHPRGKREIPKRGVFSTRSPVRPNPIGVSELEVLEIDGTRLKVKGLDVVDTTPIIDIKMKI